jgi:hypothetical protein
MSLRSAGGGLSNVILHPSTSPVIHSSSQASHAHKSSSVAAETTGVWVAKWWNWWDGKYMEKMD